MKGKPLIAVAAHTHHLGVYPFSSEVIGLMKEDLEGLETAQGTIRFPYGSFPEDDLIEKLVGLRKKEIG